MRFDRVYDFRQFQADPFGLYHKLLHLTMQNAFTFATAGGRQTGDYGSYAGLRFEKALVNEVLDHFVSGVGVDLKVAGQAAHRRKRLSGLKLSADKSLDRGVDNLVEDRLTGSKFEPK